MRLRNLSRWKLSEDTDGLLFFAQRFDELLFDFSLDTYKPPALNATSLCVEAIDVIAEIEKGSIERSNLEPILEELRWSIQKDSVAKSLLDSDVEYYTLHNDQTPLGLTKLRLEVLGRTINDQKYTEQVLAHLGVAIQSNDKSAVDALATTLVTSLVNGGSSKQFLFNATHEYFFSPEGEPIQSWNEFLGFVRVILPRQHKFDTYFVATSLIRQVSESLASFRTEIVDEIPKGALVFPVDGPISDSEVYVKVGPIEARDPYAARQLAVRRLDNLSDLFTLFAHRSQISWRSEALVVNSCCAMKTAVVLPPRGPMQKAFDLRPDRASKELNLLIRKFAARRDMSSFQRFNRVVDLHGIAVAHDIADNQLVNVWTALETLVPASVSDSKIKQIVRAVLPFVGHTYVQKLLESLLFDLTTWDKWRTKKLLNKVPCKKGASALERLAALVVSSDCEDLRQELYSRLGHFHLLRFRVFQLSRKLSTSKSVIKLLELHEQKVTWQLRRLYRARNLIVHTSKSPSFLEALIENGHAYLDGIVFDVIKLSCGDYQVRTIEQAFELSAIAYQKFRRRIASVEQFSPDAAANLLGTIRPAYEVRGARSQHGKSPAPAVEGAGTSDDPVPVT